MQAQSVDGFNSNAGNAELSWTGGNGTWDEGNSGNLIWKDDNSASTYYQSGDVVAARFDGEDVNFVSQMYLDDDPPIAAGRQAARGRVSS